MSRNINSPLGLIKAAVATLMLAALAACATPFNANVQRFSQALPAPQGQTFAIVADDQALAGGLEFSQYAGLVANKLQNLGYSPAANSGNADMIVRFDYGVDKGRDKVRRTASHDPFWNPWYGYGPRSYTVAPAITAAIARWVPGVTAGMIRSSMAVMKATLSTSAGSA